MKFKILAIILCASSLTYASDLVEKQDLNRQGVLARFSGFKPFTSSQITLDQIFNQISADKNKTVTPYSVSSSKTIQSSSKTKKVSGKKTKRKSHSDSKKVIESIEKNANQPGYTYTKTVTTKKKKGKKPAKKNKKVITRQLTDQERIDLTVKDISKFPKSASKKGKKSKKKKTSSRHK